MAKIPDFSKFDLQGIINSVKSIVSPETITPNVPEGDPIGTKILAINALIQNVSHAHTQSAKDLGKINILLNELYQDLEATRKQSVDEVQQTAGSTVERPVAPEQPKQPQAEIKEKSSKAKQRSPKDPEE
jgi:hypothetical protein